MNLLQVLGQEFVPYWYYDFLHVVDLKSPEVLADGELFPGQKFTPGGKRFYGFLLEIRNAWEMSESHFHVFATAATANILNFPFEKFHKENFKMLIHPIGGDIYFILQ